MTELLLITDIPRLRQVFSQLADLADVRLRVSASLENGANEIVAEKPAIVFVQTYLSGFSPEILLRHLKKQLGRRRTRFVLLSPKEHVSEEVLKLYQGHIDTALDDNELYDSIIETVRTSTQKVKSAPEPHLPLADNLEAERQAETVKHDAPAQLERDLALTDNQATAPVPGTNLSEASLEDQGITYAPRLPLSVYSEFTSSFDDAVGSMPAKEQSQDSGHWAGIPDNVTDIEPSGSRLKRGRYVFWGVVVLMLVVGITILQQRHMQPKPLDIAPVAPSLAEKTVSATPATPQSADKKTVIVRLSKLPEFIPRENRDKAYSKANPGWARYTGLKAEYRVFWENNTIKAIQVMGRNGNGLSDAFTLELLKQLVKAPKFLPESSEKKDGYEIQRGRLTDDISMVYYRDAEGGKLRAFVATWK